MDNRPTPIIVCGSARSGTTHLTNLLATHPRVAGVQHPLHYGNIELNACHHKLHWGDRSSVETFQAFVGQFVKGDFFRATRLDAKSYLERTPQPLYEFFFDLLDDYAAANQAEHWVVKLDPLFFSFPRDRREFFSRLTQRYAQQHFIYIQRDWQAVMRSYIQMEGHSHQLRQKRAGRIIANILGCARIVQQQRAFRRIIAERKGTTLPFQFVTSDEQDLRQRLSTIIGSGWSNETEIAVPASPNSSFHEAGDLAARSSKAVSRLAACSMLIFRTLPFAADLLLKTYERIRKRPNPLYRRIEQLEQEPDMLRRDLEARGAHQLIAELFPTPAQGEHPVE